MYHWCLFITIRIPHCGQCVLNIHSLQLWYICQRHYQNVLWLSHYKQSIKFYYWTNRIIGYKWPVIMDACGHTQHHTNSKQLEATTNRLNWRTCYGMQDALHTIQACRKQSILICSKQIPLTRLPLTTVGVNDVGIQKSCFQVM